MFKRFILFLLLIILIIPTACSENIKMTNLNSEDAKLLLEMIDKRIDEKVPTQVSKGFSAVVVSLGTGYVTVHLPTDAVGIDIVVQNLRELPLEIGDEVYIVAINGNLSNAIVDFRKNILFNDIYVDYNTGVDDYKHGNSSDHPFKTLRYAINRLSKNLNGRNINIYFNTLDPTERIYIDGFHGGGTLFIQPYLGTSISNIDYLQIVGNYGVRIEVHYLGFTNTTESASVKIGRSSYVCIYNCESIVSSSNLGISVFDGSKAVVENCTIENRRKGIMSDGCCDVLSKNNIGNNTEYGLWAQYNSTIGKIGTQCTGTIGNELALSGSEIR